MYIPIKKNIKLYCEISDEKNLADGKPFLFLIPGGPGINHAIYKTHSIELENAAHIVYIDPRGCGKSSKGKIDTYTLENAIDDIEQIRRYLQLKKFMLLGTSYGTMVALGYAIKYPQYLDRLITIAGAASYHFIDDAKNNLLQCGNKQQIDICQKFLWDGKFKASSDIVQFFKIMGPMYSFRSRNKKIKNKGAYSDKRINFAIKPQNYAFRTFFKSFDYVSELHKIICKTLVLVGKYDWINAPKHARVIAKNIPNATLKIYENCGHAVAVDQHEKYINDITKFIRDK
jgi:proline iminopeptidase